MNATSQGLAFIASKQRADGSFVTFSSPSEQPFISKVPYITTFAQALMLAALTTVPGAASQRLRRRLAAWLLKQRSASWTFNYWPRDSLAAKRLPYPDDLDDTFCALLALRLHNPVLINADCLGKAVKVLIATEAQTGGPYRTWLVSPNSEPIWHDIDLAVNSNVAAFIQLMAGPLPNVTRFMEKAIMSQQLTSPYYPSLYSIVYYLARAYQGPARSKLAKYLLTKCQDGHWETPLKTALAVSSLIQLGKTNACASGIDYLLASQQTDGSWPAEGFCIDPTIAGQRHYNGGAVLTTSFVIEALARFEGATTKHRSSSKKAFTAKQSGLRQQIYAAAKADLGLLEQPLARHCLSALTNIQRADERGEITLLPAFFSKALKSPPAWNEETKLAELGKANLYGWMAYTIYDDFLDNNGRVELLGVANVTLRRSLTAFAACMPGSVSQQLVGRTFDHIDSANAWEIANCRLALEQDSITIDRLPHYGKRSRLAERSLGHTLTPLAILLATGIGLNHPVVRLVRQGLKHYIIARQLSDDLHDWEEDIRKGQVSYIVCKLLRDLGLPPGTYALSELIPRMQRQFWYHSLRPLCDTLTDHITQARQSFTASGLFTTKNKLFELLDYQQTRAEYTLQDQSEAKAFLKSYSEQRKL